MHSLISQHRHSRWHRHAAIVLATAGLLAAASQATAAVTLSDYTRLSQPDGIDSISFVGKHAAALGQVVGVGFTYVTGNPSTGIIWTQSGGSISLQTNTYIYGTDGTHQVGFQRVVSSNYTHAMLWNGSAASVVDLNPSGFATSSAWDVHGAYQVGYGGSGAYEHALLWHGSAASVVDLNPVNFQLTYAYGTNGTQQVGSGTGSATGFQKHALLWNGTANSVVDLHPSGFNESFAYGTNGSQQVGIAQNNIINSSHAMLWNGTAASAVDLNPSGYQYSYALDTNGTQQVGYGRGPGSPFNHALMWTGTAGSVLDLQSLLPNYFFYSEAHSISGNSIYGLAQDIYSNYYAVTWTIGPNLLLPGDSNSDGVVDVADYNNVINNFGHTGLGDTNGDQHVTITDYNNVINNFGASAVATFIPEPASLSLLAIGVVGLLRRRHKIDPAS